MNRQQRSPFFLLVCPKNLKECIDWVLRATGKDIQNGTDNIEKLKKALKAVVLSFNNNSNALNELANGLCLFLGYPSCLCSLKANVDRSLKDIFKKLIQDFKAVQSSHSISTLNLNCNSCNSNDILCKCCVISCIKELRGKSQCDCVQKASKDCSCSNSEGKCCKDVLSGLEACLSLLNLKTDMAGCTCVGPGCCKDGKCTAQCDLCSPKNFPDNAMTGLGICPMNPRKLAEKLDNFFGDRSKKSCDCRCNGSIKSCCCLACQSCSSQHCSCSSSGSSGQCSCAQALQSQGCPRKVFCQNINSIKVTVGSSLMKCCERGQKCHCGLTSGSQCSGCCSEKDKQSLKCMLRRVVSYFKDLDSHSGKFFKSCCDLLCVAKTCEFLKMFYDKRTATECSECKPGGKGKCSGSSVQCCNGTISKCNSGFCQNCDECQQICYAKEFSKALETLRFAGPCGQDLYRVLKDFLYFCCNVIAPQQSSIEDKLKKLTKNCCKVQKNGSPCTCCSSVSSSSGNCEGCKALLQDSKLKALLFSQYSSSYSSASFPSSGEQEKAAKIFLGMLPCLYYGLKILYDRSQDPVTWPDWQSIDFDRNGNPSSGLAKFLQALGYGLDPLKTKNASDLPPILDILYGSGKFKSLYDFVSQKYFSIHVSTSNSPPQTVRQMLLWLYGLRFHKHFSDLVSHCSSLCSPFGNSFHPDAFCYYIHTCCFLLPVSVISFIETSDSTAAKFFSSAEWKSFSYPEDPFKLFETFCDFVRKIYIPLHFLRFQCSLDKDQAGWQNCWYGSKCKVEPLSPGSASGSSSNSGCSCQGSKTYLCTGSSKHSGCKPGSSSCSGSCPHHLLRFLCDSDSDPSSPSPSSDSKSLFQPPPDYPKMGFESSKLSSTARDGYDLHGAIEVFCDDGFYPLTRLLQFVLCVSQRPPETLGELFAFFFRFSESDVFKNFGDYVDGEPGRYPGKALKDAVQGFYGSEDSHKISSHPSDLRSLIACPGQKGSSTCGKYLHPLTYNAYNNNIFIDDFMDTYLSWVCYSAEDFKKKLKGFYNEASTKFKTCCSSGKCQKIVECPCALPFFYSFGFGFWSPNTLNSGKKSCQNFIDQLRFVIWGDPFKKLLKEIEKFLWSIRLPFFLFVLAFWAFVISYFLYVQLYKLDLLHIDSHLHLPRSFKILPSTLFSDASSKLKDLSYFTL